MKRAFQGLAALVAVTFILFGWPLLLWQAATGPLLAYLPDLSNVAFAVTHPDATGLLLALVLLAAGAAWAVTAGALVIELVAQARGMSAPQLGGGRFGGLVPQVSMSRLAATALFIVPMSGNLAGTPAAAVDIAPEAATAAMSASAAGLGTACATSDQVPIRSYIVKPGDTLWSVAQQLLGDGDRYPEVFRASRALPQPDGGKLRNPDLIRPGWHLAVPTARSAKGARDCGDQPTPSPAKPRQTTQPAPSKATQAPQAHPPTTHSPQPDSPKPGSPTPGSATAPPPQAHLLERGLQPGSTAPPPKVDRRPVPAPAATTLPRPNHSGSVPIDRGDRSPQAPGLPGPTVRVAAANPDRAELTWPAVPGASGYWVTVNGQSMQVTTTAIAVRGLAGGTHYRVEVRTLFANGQWSAATTVEVTTADEPATRPHPAASPAKLRALRHPAFTGRSLADPTAVASNGDCPASRCLARMRTTLGITESPLDRANPQARESGSASGNQPSRVSAHRRAQLPEMAAALVALRPPGMDRGTLLDQAMQMSSSWLPGSAADFITSGVASVRT